MVVRNGVVTDAASKYDLAVTGMTKEDTS